MLSWLAGCLCVFGAAAPEEPCGFLTTVTTAPDGTILNQTVPYIPHEGDIVCYNDHSPNWKFL